MKIIVALIVTFICVTSANGQSTSFIGKSYEATVNLTVYEITAAGLKDITHPHTVVKGTKFTVNEIVTGNDLKITFWNFGPEVKALPVGFAKNYAAPEDNIDAWADQKNFIIELNTFTTATRIYYGKNNEFSWGVMTLPIKARFGNKKDHFFDFEENLNLGFTAGLKHQIEGSHESWINYLGGVSITRVRTDSISLKNHFAVPEAKVSSALMFSAGFLYQYESFQVGIFTGIDVIPGEIGRNWKHQAKPWVGFALGVSLFTKNTAGTATGKN